MDERAAVRAWLDENWDPDLPLLEWRNTLVDSGWGCPVWPLELYGRGLDNAAAGVVADEFQIVGAVGVAAGTGTSLVAPTLLTHGSEALNKTYLRRIATGEDKWCQLFSEPGNGSDLAGLTTRAERDGDEWVINGQKVWNTGAKTAAYAMLVARTDFDVPKHKGITYFVFPMRQDGVEVRPLAQMNGHSSFNEVFMTDARVPHDCVVGDIGEGWRVALTTLSHERGLGTRAPPSRTEPTGRTQREARQEADEYNRTYIWYPQRAGRADLLVSRAQAVGANEDAVIRQQVVDATSLDRASRWNVARAKAARAQGRPPGPEGSLAKLNASEVARRSARAHGAIAGAHGMLSGPESPLEGTIAEILVSVPGQSIAGGTDEIQHNIIGERVLGLPKEPQVDRDIPFREVKKN